MIAKLIEVRDRNTCIPALAVSLRIGPGNRGCQTDHSGEIYLLRRSGFGAAVEEAGPHDVILVSLNSFECQYDPNAWSGPRTMPTAHRYLQRYFDYVESGQVIDVRVLLGEAESPAISERLDG